MRIQLPPHFTTVTTFSKLIAIFLFLLFPILGFKLGMEYQKLNVTTDNRYYLGNTKQCTVIEYVCPDGYQGFGDDKGCGCERTKMTKNQFSDSPQVKKTTDILLSVQYIGGLCPDGVCQSKRQVLKNGTTQVDGAASEPLDKADLNELIRLVNSTDYEAVKAQKFTGTCPVAYDGQETIYTFYTSHGTEQIASCTVEVDLSHPLFSKVHEVLE